MLRAGATAGRSLLKAAAVPAGVGLVGAYAYGTAKYRRNAKTTYAFDDPPVPGSDEFDRLLAAISGATTTSGNRVTVLRNGGRTFPSMLAAIATATGTIDLSSYIYWPGEVASAFTEASRRGPGPVSRSTSSSTGGGRPSSTGPRSTPSSRPG